MLVSDFSSLNLVNPGEVVKLGTHIGHIKCINEEKCCRQCCRRVLYLLSLDSGMAAVASIIVAVGSVVDGVTVIVTHERLRQKQREKLRAPLT